MYRDDYQTDPRYGKINGKDIAKIVQMETRPKRLMQSKISNKSYFHWFGTSRTYGKSEKSSNPDKMAE